jgi:hypothetical protein
MINRREGPPVLLGGNTCIRSALLFYRLAAGGFSGSAAVPLVGFHHFHLRAFGQTVDTVGDHAIAGGKPGADHHFQAVLNTRRHGVFADLVLIVQHPDEMAFVAHLQRGGWDHHRVLLGIDQHAGVDELVREQGVVLVVKRAFSLMVPVVASIWLSRLSSEPSLIFCLLVRSQASTASFFPPFAPAPPWRFGFPAA